MCRSQIWPQSANAIFFKQLKSVHNLSIVSLFDIGPSVPFLAGLLLFSSWNDHDPYRVQTLPCTQSISSSRQHGQLIKGRTPWATRWVTHSFLRIIPRNGSIVSVSRPPGRQDRLQSERTHIGGPLDWKVAPNWVFRRRLLKRFCRI